MIAHPHPGRNGDYAGPGDLRKTAYHDAGATRWCANPATRVAAHLAGRTNLIAAHFPLRHISAILPRADSPNRRAGGAALVTTIFVGSADGGATRFAAAKLLGTEAAKRGAYGTAAVAAELIQTAYRGAARFAATVDRIAIRSRRYARASAIWTANRPFNTQHRRARVVVRLRDADAQAICTSPAGITTIEGIIDAGVTRRALKPGDTAAPADRLQAGDRRHPSRQQRRGGKGGDALQRAAPGRRARNDPCQAIELLVVHAASSCRSRAKFPPV